MSERARAALRALAEKYAKRAVGATAYPPLVADEIHAVSENDSLWDEPLVVADEESLAADIREYASHAVLSNIGCSMLAKDLIAAGVVQTRAQAVAALVEDEALVERTAANVHAAWMEAKTAQGITSRPSETGEEQMVHYADLSEAAKSLDRASVLAVFAALSAPADSGGTE